MAIDNTITVTGNLTRDPELRYTTSGRGVASASLAVNRRWKNQRTDEWEEDVAFMNVVAWGELGEHWAESMRKGQRCFVTGRLAQREYETREGEKRQVYEIVADDVGPSLKFATAEVTRVERDQAPRGGGGQRQADPVYGDEEPF